MQLHFAASPRFVGSEPSDVELAARDALPERPFQLEEQLGVTLFQRRTRSVVLTPVGRQLLDDLEPALGALVGLDRRHPRGFGGDQLRGADVGHLG